MYQAGIYCRVSIEEQNKEGEYSNSIHSQIQMARDYIAEQNDITEVRVYADDDFPEAILTEQNSEECWQILNWGQSIW